MLEKQILQKLDESEERPSKRQKTSATPSPETTTAWIELSKYEVPCHVIPHHTIYHTIPYHTMPHHSTNRFHFAIFCLVIDAKMTSRRGKNKNMDHTVNSSGPLMFLQRRDDYLFGFKCLLCVCSGCTNLSRILMLFEGYLAVKLVLSQ